MTGRDDAPVSGSGSVDGRLVRAGAVCGGAFVLLAVSVWSGWARLVTFDERWAQRGYAFMLGHTWCETAARIATWTAGGPVITLLTATVAIGCAVRSRRPLAW